MQQLCHGFTRFIPALWLEMDRNGARHLARIMCVTCEVHPQDPIFPQFCISSRVETLFATWDLIFCLFLTSVSESLMFSLPVIVPFCSFIFGLIVLSCEHDCLETEQHWCKDCQSERSQSCSSFNHVGFPLSNSWWLSSYRKWVGSSGSEYYNILSHVFSFVPNFSSKVTAWVAFPMLMLVKKIDFYFSFSSLWQILKPVLIVQLTIVVCIFTISGTN